MWPPWKRRYGMRNVLFKVIFLFQIKREYVIQFSRPQKQFGVPCRLWSQFLNRSKNGAHNDVLHSYSDMFSGGYFSSLWNECKHLPTAPFRPNSSSRQRRYLSSPSKACCHHERLSIFPHSNNSAVLILTSSRSYLCPVPPCNHG